MFFFKNLNGMDWNFIHCSINLHWLSRQTMLHNNHNDCFVTWNILRKHSNKVRVTVKEKNKYSYVTIHMSILIDTRVYIDQGSHMVPIWAYMTWVIWLIKGAQYISWLYWLYLLYHYSGSYFKIWSNGK